MMKQDAKTKGGTLESGTTEKSDLHHYGPDDCGMGSVGPNQGDEGGFRRPKMKGNKPQANPVMSVSRGHKIR